MGSLMITSIRKGTKKLLKLQHLFAENSANCCYPFLFILTFHSKYFHRHDFRVPSSFFQLLLSMRILRVCSITV